MDSLYALKEIIEVKICKIFFVGCGFKASLKELIVANFSD